MPSDVQEVSKLWYEIIEVKTLTVSGAASPESMRAGAVHQPDQAIDVVSFEWHHEDGFPPDTREEVIQISGIGVFLDYLLREAQETDILSSEQMSRVANLSYKLIQRHTSPNGVCAIPVKMDVRNVIKDQISVRHGSSKSVIMQAIEEKKERLAQALGVSL